VSDLQHIGVHEPGPAFVLVCPACADDRIVELETVQGQSPTMNFITTPTVGKRLNNPTWCWIFSLFSLIGGVWGIPISIYFGLRAIGLRQKEIDK